MMVVSLVVFASIGLERENAVRAGRVIVSGKADEGIRSRRNNLRNIFRARIDYVDRFVRSVGQKVRVDCRIDPADIEREQLVPSGVPGDGNDRLQYERFVGDGQ